MMAQIAQDAVREALGLMQQQALVRSQPQTKVVQTVVIDEDRDQKLLKEFMRYKPSPFLGKVGPLLALVWMWMTEKILG